MLQTAFGLVLLVLFLAPFALIVRKAGYSPFWVVLALVPVVNYFALALFALSEWPIERELRLQSPRPALPETPRQIHRGN